jgi:hypothetical protein
VVVTGAPRKRLAWLVAGHVGSNPTLSATFSLPAGAFRLRQGFLLRQGFGGQVGGQVGGLVAQAGHQLSAIRHQ